MNRIKLPFLSMSIKFTSAHSKDDTIVFASILAHSHQFKSSPKKIQIFLLL